MRLVLLGGAGRVGTWISPWLRGEDHEVVVADMISAPGVISANALDRVGMARLFEGADAVLHLCAIVPRGSEATSPSKVGQAWQVNVGSVAQALLACADAHVPRFIHVSSLSVFTKAGVEPLPAGESTDALEPYGLTKRVAESVCSMLSEQLGIDAVSLRLGWPTSDELAPLWLQPLTDKPSEVRLADGTPLDALSGKALARIIDVELRRPLTAGHRVENAVANPHLVFKSSSQ